MGELGMFLEPKGSQATAPFAKQDSLDVPPPERKLFPVTCPDCGKHWGWYSEKPNQTKLECLDCGTAMIFV